MEHSIEFVEGQVADALVTITGEMTVEGNLAWLAELVGDERWHAGMRTLVDMTTITIDDSFGGTQVQEVAMPTVAEDDVWGAGCSAVLVSTPAVYGVIRMWQAYTEHMAWQTGVFYDRDEALAWLADPHRT
jgi:hypothetical protein